MTDNVIEIPAEPPIVDIQIIEGGVRVWRWEGDGVHPYDYVPGPPDDDG